MKPKFLIPLLIAVFTLVNFSGAVHANIFNDDSLEMLREFYTDYITESLKETPSPKRLNSLRKQYCTAGLLSKIQNAELDYDPFLNAQDVDKDWLRTLSVTKDPQRKKDGYIISFVDNDSKTKTVIKLLLVKEGQRYKIDAITY